MVRRLLAAAGPRPEIPAEDLDAIDASLKAAWKAEVQNRRRSRARRRTLAILAAAAAVLAVAVGLDRWRRESVVAPAIARVDHVTGDVRLEAPDRSLLAWIPGARSRRLAAGEEIDAGSSIASGSGYREGRASLELADGTSLRLDVGTSLRLLSTRQLELDSGALYVATGPAHRQPLEIRTPLASVRDSGTQFVVRLGRDPQAVFVMVREGVVVLENDRAAHRVEAGEELSLQDDGAFERHAVPSYGGDWGWVLAAGPGLALEGRGIHEVLDWVGRETGWTIRYQDERAEEISRTKTFGGGPEIHPEDIVLFLETANLAGEVVDGTLTIRSLP
jgi:ferric-dicitrate binding protein FerR (iron transport regulator)